MLGVTFISRSEICHGPPAFPVGSLCWNNRRTTGPGTEYCKPATEVTSNYGLNFRYYIRSERILMMSR